jgi:hypothetical protein
MLFTKLVLTSSLNEKTAGMQRQTIFLNQHRLSSHFNP